MRIALGVFLLLFLLLAALQFPAVQTYLAGKVTQNIAKRAGTEIFVKRIGVRLPGAISLQGVYLEDHKADTLLYAGKINIDVRLLGLLRNHVGVQRLQMSDVTVNMLRFTPDSLFNYDTLIRSIAGEQPDRSAFSSGATENGYLPGNKKMPASSRLSQKPDDPSPGEDSHWTFDVGNIDLKNIRFRFADHFSGLDLSVQLDELQTHVDTLDIDGDKYYLGNTRIAGGFVSLVMKEGTHIREPSEEAPGKPPDVGMAKLLLEEMAFRVQEGEDLLFDTRLDMLEAKSRNIDAGRLRFELEYAMAESVAAEVAGMGFSDVAFHMEDLFYSSDSLGGVMKNMRGKESGGFSLKQLSAAVALGHTTRIDDLYIETTGSLLDGCLHTSLPLMQLKTPVSPEHSLHIDLREAQAGKDLVLLVPWLEIFFPDPHAPAIELQTSATGTLADIRLDTLAAHVRGRFKTGASGRITGYPDLNNLFMDLPLIRVSANPDEVIAYLPDNVRPQGLHFPASIDLYAGFKGLMNDFYADARLEMGFTEITGAFQYEQTKGEDPVWEGSVELAGKNPLSIIAPDDRVTDLYASISAYGKGFDPSVMALELEGVIDSLRFNDYTYRGMVFNASALDGHTSLVIGYHDDHLSFGAENVIDLRNEHPGIRLDWKLNHLNARELMFTDDLIAIQTNIVAEATLKRPDFPDGWLFMHDTHVLLDREVLSMDSLKVILSSNEEQYIAEVISPLLTMNYRGDISPASIPPALLNHLRGYMEPDGDRNAERDAKDGTDGEDPSHEAFVLDVRINPSPYFSELLFPQISSFDTITANVSFNSRTNHLLLDAAIPDMIISGWHLNDLGIHAGSGRGYLDFSLRMPLLDGDQLILSNLEVTGGFSERMLDFELSFDDRHDVSWLRFSGQMAQHDEYTEFRFDRDMVVNRQDWHVAPDHYLRFHDTGFVAHNLRISSADKELALLSSDIHDMGSPLGLYFQNIDLGNFDLIGDAPIADVIFNGAVIVSDLFSRPVYTADLSIDDLGFQGEGIGDVGLLVFGPEPGLFQAEASVRGYGNRLDLSGIYRQEPAFIDFELRVENLSLPTVEALTFEQLSDMEGAISGDLRLTGDPSTPDMLGALHFNQVSFHAAFLNARYTIPQESVVFDNHQIRFSNFTLADRSGRLARLDGNVALHDLSDIRFDLRLSSRNFLLMDLPRGTHELFYGRLLIDTDLTMRGDIAQPVVEGRLKLNRGSAFVFIPPQAMPAAIGDEGVVEFFSVYDDVFADLLLRPEEPVAVLSAFENLDISVNVEVDPQTEVRILIDEVAGDYLEARGGGLISYSVDPGGRISLAGRYEISQGAYQMTFYDVMRRHFSIEEGSSIVWTGDPLDAAVDITAKYTVRATTRELMASHAPAAGQLEAAYRQIYPFEVLLKMKGELMSPEISFEISLPSEHRGALEGRLQARLNELNQSESELNKQVFALLILGSFIQDDPLAAVTAGPGISATARTSASRLLSQQLNRLSDRYIRGIDISFEMESYEEIDDGQLVGRTELQMEVSRDFLDQRLRITVGGHLELEDETRRQVNPADIAGDFSVEYLLDPDGRLTLKGYRERKYQDIYEGELVETGLSLIFRQTFNHFRELFMKKEETLQPDFSPPSEPGADMDGHENHNVE